MNDVIQAKICTDCEADVTVEIPDSLSKDWQKKLRDWEIICNACDQARQAEHEREARAAAAKAVWQARRDRVRRAEMPAMLREITWDGVDEQGRRGAVQAVRRWAAGDLPGVLLTGAIGVGKTTIAAAAAWEFLDRGALRWMSVPTLMARLGSGFSDPSRQAALGLLNGTEALVLDDLDKTRPSEYAAEQLFNAIDRRVTAGAGLLVTTNLMPDRLADRYPDPYGDALASRLAGYCEIHGVSGQDRRIRSLVGAA